MELLDEKYNFCTEIEMENKQNIKAKMPNINLKIVCKY